MTLITYMDGSDAAKAFVAYIRYIPESGNRHVSLLASKAKLNPAGGQSTPRSEMDGHTLGSRGAKTITEALKDVTPPIRRVYMLGDSRTVLAALKSEATPFSEFFANRIGEVYDCIRAIPENSEVIWDWVQSSNNAADIASRVTATPDIMGGPQDLPQEELRKQYKHLSFQQQEKKSV